MNSLITKTTALTDEQYQDMLKNIISAAYHALLCSIGCLIVVTIGYIVYKKWDDPISGIIAFFTGIISVLLFVSLILIIGFGFIISVSKQPGKTMVQNDAPLTEIKEQIKIDNNRLTINPLPENYQYQNKTLDKTKPHDFKIDDFYKESNVKLIDSNNNTYEITHEQLEELKK